MKFTLKNEAFLVFFGCQKKIASPQADKKNIKKSRVLPGFFSTCV
jgi:hypothetical protein